MIFPNKLEFFVRVRPFQSNLLLVSKTEAYPRGVPFRYYTLGRLVSFSTNFGLGWNGFPGTNTLAY